MTRPGGAATAIWAVLAIIAAAIVAHASYTADLSAFLPRSPTATQQLLIEQLRSGPAARLLLLAIEGGSGAERSQVSAELARRLRADPAFVAVNNGDAAGRRPRPAEAVWRRPDRRHALLMATVRAAGSDTDAQRAACDTVRRAFASSLGAIPAAARPSVTLLMTGPPVFAVASRALIKG